MLRHVSKPARIVVPVSAERRPRAMCGVRLPRRRAEPHVPIESGWHRLCGGVHASRPPELPREPLTGAERALDRPLAEQPVLHDLPDRLHRGAEAVERPLEAEPCVQAEHAPLLAHHLHHALAFAHGARHGLLAPYVLACVRRHHAHAAMPVRRRADVDDVDIPVCQQLHEVPVRLDVAEPLLLCALQPGRDTVGVRIAQTYQPRTGERQVVGGMGYRSKPYQRARKLV